MASLTPAGAPTNLAPPMTTTISPAAFEGDARGGARVQVRGLSKAFEHGGRTIDVLRGLDFDLAPGEMASVVGASGVGKSTLLQVLGTLDAPSAGTITFDGVDVTAMNATRLAEFRNREIGFVFQFHHLLPEFTALENAMMPGLILRQPRRLCAERAAAMLARIGLRSDRLRLPVPPPPAGVHGARERHDAGAHPAAAAAPVRRAGGGDAGPHRPPI